MQIEIYKMTAEDDALTIELEAVCDSFSSLIWDVEYYECGRFEVYIAANPITIDTFRTGRIVGRDDDDQHFGLIESVHLATDAENGDYLTVKGRFLMCLLERRIIHPTFSVTTETAYSEIVRSAVTQNAVTDDIRKLPGLELGTVSGACWEQPAKLQISYANLMEWVYTICKKIGGTANIRLMKATGEQYKMVLDLSQGVDRSILQEERPHVVFSDAYSNLLSFSYAADASVQRNFAYVFGQGKGEERKRTTYCSGEEPAFLDRYEVYVDADDISAEEQVDGETRTIPEEEYIELLKSRGAENMVQPQLASESEIAVCSTQYTYKTDYTVGDYVTVQHKRFGLLQPKLQLITGVTVTESDAERFNLPQGVYVYGVAENSAAAKAGLQQGDIITEIDGAEITTMEELSEQKNKHQAGDTVTLRISRSGETIDVQMTLQEVKQED